MTADIKVVFDDCVRAWHHQKIVFCVAIHPPNRFRVRPVDE
jgi:hypothetical protein